MNLLLIHPFLPTRASNPGSGFDELAAELAVLVAGAISSRNFFLSS